MNMFDIDWLYTAFNHFNLELFNGELPECDLSTIHLGDRHGTQETFGDLHFITIDILTVNDDTELYSTLVHEMAHVWQAKQLGGVFENPHCDVWLAKMAEIGLPPFMSIHWQDEPQHCSNEVAKNGPFINSLQALIQSGFQTPWVRLGKVVTSP